MALNLESFVINGPTTNNNLPPFSWVGRFSNVTHVGLPDVYNFGWQTMKSLLSDEHVDQNRFSKFGML